MIRPAKKLVLESGESFVGEGFGAAEPRVGELVFNTSVVGYQEIISDPSYAQQIVVMTYPLIGNYGIADEDYESRNLLLGGLVVRECCDTPSNFRSTKTLEEELEDHGIPGLSGVDTRLLTKIIRRSGRPMAAIVDADMPLEKALELIRTTPRPANLVQQVSCRKRWVTRTSNHRFHVVAIDCGIKFSVIRLLNQRGCNVTIVPSNTDAQTVRSYHPDGVLLSNGPVSALEVPELQELVNHLRGKVPVMGIGLGMEAIGLASGAELQPMGCGIHGDHPVRDLESGRINIAVLNQTYRFNSVEGTSLTPTHVMVPEGFVVGFKNCADKLFGVQFHLESAPGPQDNLRLFDTFIQMMEGQSHA